MCRENLKEEIEALEEEKQSVIDDINLKIKLIKKLYENKENYLKLKLVYNPQGFALWVYNKKELHNVRQALREAFGEWQDKTTMISDFIAEGRVVYGYIGQNEDLKKIQIYYLFPYDKIPKQFQKKGCGFKNIKKIDKEWVCEVIK